MERELNKISKYSEKKFIEYLNSQSIDDLHKMKLYTDDIYYNTGNNNILEDDRYDLLKENIIMRNPTLNEVGAIVKKGERVNLPYWLGSMDKLSDNKNINRWIDKFNTSNYILEYKLDGVSCLLIIKNSKIKLYTRGNGKVGSDISHLTSYISNIPQNIDNIDIAVRGELIIKKNIFKEKYSLQYANARNMVSGILSSKDFKIDINDIEFISYEIINTGVVISPEDQLQQLQNIGFKIVPYRIVSSIEIDFLKENLINFKNESEYQIDGLIVISNEKYVRNIKGNPKYAFAFKMRNNVKQAKVESVEWNVTKWGVLKPRIKIKPIMLNSVVINYTTGFNAKFICDNNINTGTVLNITRSGDVIPHIVNVVTQSSHPSMPECEYKWNKNKIDIVTTNFKQKNIEKIKLISSFFSNLEIKYINIATTTKLYENGLNSIIKIVSASIERLEQVDSICNKSATRIFNNIKEKLNNITIPKLLGASGVFGFGIGYKKILILFKEIPDLLTLNTDKDDLLQQIENINGFSSLTSNKIFKNLDNAKKFIEEISPYCNFDFVQDKKIDGIFLNQTFVFSGFRDKTLESFINNNGGKVINNISKNVHFLIVNDTNKITNKTKLANKLNIQIYSKQYFENNFV